MKKRKNIHNLLDDLETQEQDFLECEFLAPALAGGAARVRLGGVVCKLSIAPASFTGFGVFQPVSFNEAVHVRDATLTERLKYLRLFPRVRMILTLQRRNRWLAVPANSCDARFEIEGLAPVSLVEQTQTFDIVDARFDGSQFWFEQPDPTQNAATAAFLRQALSEEKAPAGVERPGLTPQQQYAYSLAHQAATQPPAPPQPRETRSSQPRSSQSRNSQSRTRVNLQDDRSRLREGLASAGARLIDYLEHRDSFRVSFTVDGDHFVSAVNKSDLSVQAAGICLEGRDRDFDLQSLVGVIREGQQQGLIYRM